MRLVTSEALVKRINRRLRPDGQMLRRARRWTVDTGDVYLVDSDHNFFLKGHVDVAALARELGLLYAGEQPTAREQDG
jgi:hypothetical protein